MASILIGDKNGNVREFLKREFIKEGYHVVLAKDAKELMALFNGEKSPDLLIMDLLLPFMDGPAILEKLRESVPHIPIIVYTTLIEYRDHPTVLKNADAFIEKEGELSQLKIAVSKLISQPYPRSEKGGSSWKGIKT